MKNKYKLLILSFIISFVSFLSGINSVYAYGIKYNAWRQDVDGDKKPDLIFRRYSYPTEKMLEAYDKEKEFDVVFKDNTLDRHVYKYNGKTKTSKWIYVDKKGIYKPLDTEFSTVGYTFHTEKHDLFKVMTTTNNTNDVGVFQTTVPTTSNIGNSTYDYFYNSQIVYGKLLPASKLEGVLYEYYGVDSILKDTAYGTGINMSSITPKDKMIYRYAIVNIGDENIYIEDRVIYHDELQRLRKAKEEAGANRLYISDIVISDAKYDMGGYELAKTGPQFFSQYKKYGYSSDFWPEIIRGAGSKAAGVQSVMNVFSNELVLPETSKKQILVRHIDLKENVTLSEQTIEAGSFLNVYEQQLIVKDDAESKDAIIYTSKRGGYEYIDEKKYYLSEMYMNVINVDKYIEKEALNGYQCLGYNVSTASSFKEAMRNINSNIKKGKYTEGSVVKLDGLVPESEEECIIIDFYYTDGLEVVYVNHLFVDKDNRILPVEEQNIPGNDYAYVGEPHFIIKYRKVAPISNSSGNTNQSNNVMSMVQEKYYRKKGQKILAKTSFAIAEDRYTLWRWKAITYKGYEIITSDTFTWQDMANAQRKVYPEKDWWKPFDSVLGIIIPDNAKQVNFYYYNRQEEDAVVPEKSMRLKYFLSAKVSGVTYDGYCKNEKGNYIISVPTSSNVKHGVANVPTTMVSAIHIVEEDTFWNLKSVKVKVNYVCGKDTISLNRGISYNIGYQKVQELVVEGLQQIVLHDDDSNRMFNEESQVYNYNYEDNLKQGFKISAAENMSPEEVNDWKKYVEIKIKDNYNSEQIVKGEKKEATLTTTFLTTEQIKDVDKDNDKKVTYNDLSVIDNTKKMLLENIEDSKSKIATLEEKFKDDKARKDKCLNSYNEVKDKLASYKTSENKLEQALIPVVALELVGKKLEYTIAEDDLKDTEKKLKNANSIREKAQKEYDEITKGYNDFLKKFEYYKSLYDEFIRIKEAAYGNSFIKSDSKLAQAAGINLSITVYNMHLTMNGESFDNNKSTTHSANLSEYFKITLEDGFVTTIVAPQLVFKRSIYNGVGNVLKEEYFTKKSTINNNTKNGERTLTGEVKYKTEVIIGDKLTIWNKSNVQRIEDNVYYSENVDPKHANTNGIFKLEHFGLTQNVELNTNVYTPITVNAELISEKSNIVDQRIENNTTTSQVIQLSAPFTVSFSSIGETGDKIYGHRELGKFAKGYYIKFNFDIHKVSIGGKQYNKGEIIKAGTWIGMIQRGDKLTATVYSDIYDENIGIAHEGTTSYVVRAVATNSTSLIQNQSLKYSTLADIMSSRSELKDAVTNICTDKATLGGDSEPSYLAEREYKVTLLNRMYDFKITDVKDVSWKKVFRSSVGSVVNQHTGNAYYSGIYRWKMENEDTNTMVNRTPSEIGTNPIRILPVGMYKHTDLKYIKAPKLGYSFSYDLKVTGNYYGKKGHVIENKGVDINTKFYYISDDGNTFLEEAQYGKAGIYLFYRNDAGQYVRIDYSGGGYNLSFIPNDGYRYIKDPEKSTLATTSVSLGNLRNIHLGPNMATVSQPYNTSHSSDNGTVITYYGEYKLPNSTIVVHVSEDGTYDINKPLKNGYIGVIFDITARSGQYGEISLAYNKNTNVKANTSQWDYEGYLGVKAGNIITEENPVNIKLEGGTWRIISNDLYNRIKGTVIMYDIDERAAEDYE